MNHADKIIQPSIFAGIVILKRLISHHALSDYNTALMIKKNKLFVVGKAM